MVPPEARKDSEMPLPVNGFRERNSDTHSMVQGRARFQVEGFGQFRSFPPVSGGYVAAG